MLNSVFVLDTTKKPMTPCSTARARQLLRDKKAAVWRRVPFTIILKVAMPDAIVKPLTIKIDPGSKETGLVLVDKDNRVMFAAELTHRGSEIKASLLSRRSLRSGRRSRNTRYRAVRFNNRARVKGWLPPSLDHRIQTTMTWVNRFQRWASIEGIAVERVKFDMQHMTNPDISGAEYQQGTLAGYTVREYLLEKWGRHCVYCDKDKVPLQVEHVIPKAKRGSNNISNLTISCGPCNKDKGVLDVADFLAKKPLVLKRILAQLKKPLSDAAAVNATRNKLFVSLLNTGLPVETGTGAQTKFNRIRLDYPKAHWIDAACVGESGATVTLNPDHKPLLIKAMGHGCRQVVRVNKYGFPCAKPKSTKTVLGLKTGDLVKLVQSKGLYAGQYVARITTIRSKDNYLSLSLNKKQIWFSAKLATLLQPADGYCYA